MLETAIILLFPFLMAFAASSDIFSMTISNKVSLALMIGFVACSYGLGMSFSDFAWHWALFAIVLIAGFALFSFGIIGGGDAKLAASTSLWLGWASTLEYVILASMLGGLLTLILLYVRSAVLPRWIENQSWAYRLHRADHGVPYGVALGAAAVIVYPSTFWMQHVFALARAG